MIYFKLNDNYGSAEYINEQLAEQVTYITESEYNFWLENHQEESIEEEKE
jgi:hypothetical protein